MSSLQEGMNLGAQLLWRWRYDKGLTQMEACKYLDSHPVQLSRWENGHGTPNRRWAVIIERVTLGQVTCGSWDDDPLPEYEIDPAMAPDFDASAIWRAKETKRKKGGGK
jgi:transcriptional regulator with XRE-family HTH domain